MLGLFLLNAGHALRATHVSLSSKGPCQWHVFFVRHIRLEHGCCFECPESGTEQFGFSLPLWSEQGRQTLL